MTVGNAVSFIKRGLTDRALRDRLNSTLTLPELYGVLDAEGLSFSSDEFEDAFNSQLVKCRDWDSADQLKEFKLWWEMLQQISARNTCKDNCEDVCDGGCCGGLCE